MLELFIMLAKVDAGYFYVQDIGAITEALEVPLAPWNWLETNLVTTLLTLNKPLLLVNILVGWSQIVEILPNRKFENLLKSQSIKLLNP